MEPAAVVVGHRTVVAAAFNIQSGRISEAGVVSRSETRYSESKPIRVVVAVRCRESFLEGCS